MKKLRAIPRVAGFQIGSRLGAGSAGEVFRATVPDTGQELALKISHRSPAGSPEDLAFRLEYQVHRAFRHPHILRAHGFGEIDAERRYYTMDLVEASPLAAIFRQGGLSVLGEVALRLCDALGYAHGQGVLHGDIKSSNILVPLSDPHSVQLADFGHARRIGERDASVTGTLATLPPERLLGWPGDSRSDLYSLGVVLFETVAGRLPWSARTPRDLLQQISDLGAPTVAPWVRADPRWAPLIDGLLSADPAGRPASAIELSRSLSRLLDRKPSTRSKVAATVSSSTLKPIGRAEEMRAALATLQDRTDVRTVFVSGEQLIGKTRFAEDFARSAELAGAEVLLADAQPDDGTAFRLARRLRQGGRLRDLLLECDLSPAGSGEADLTPALHEREVQLTRLADTILQREAGLERERLIVFDSVESADLDSIAFLERTQSLLRGTRTTLCLVTRSTASGVDALENLRAEPHLEIELRPLDPAEVREFVLSVLMGAGALRSGARAMDQDQLDAVVERLLLETGGVPGRLESELARWMRSGRLRRTEEGWTLDAAALDRETPKSTSRRSALNALRRITPRHRHFLRMAAVAGHQFDATLLAAMAPGQATSAAEFVTEAVLCGVFGRGAEVSQLKFRDPEVARAVREHLSPLLRRAEHARLAQLLAQGRGTPAEVAEHLALAGDNAGARAAFATAADAAVAQRAFRQANRLYQKAWDLYEPKERKRLPPFAVAWVRSLFANAQLDEAADVAQSLTEGAPSIPGDPGHLHLSILRGAALAASGRGADAQRELRRTLRSPRLAKHPDLHAWALTEYGKTEMERNRAASARRLLEQARGIALGAKLVLAAGRAELCLGMQAWRSDDAAAALDWHHMAHVHLQDAQARDLLPAVWGNQAICHWFLLEPRRAAELHRRAAEEYLKQRRRAEAARSYQNLAHVLTESGRFAETDEALALADDLNRSLRSPRQASFFEYHHARLALYRGRMDEAKSRIDHAIALAEGIEDDLLTVGHASLRAVIQLESGQPAAARETARQCLASSEALKYRWGIAKSHYVLGRAELALQSPAEGLDHLAEAARVAAAAQQPVVLYRVDLARAEALAALGRVADARRIVLSARSLQERSESLLWAGLLHLAAGRVEFRADAFEAASVELARAYEAFAQLGAEHLRAETLASQSMAFSARGIQAAANSAATHARALFRSLGLSPPSDLVGSSDAAPETDIGRVLRAATSIARSLATVQSLDTLLERILDVAISHLGCERGVVALVDNLSGALRVRCARNIEHESIMEGLEISWSAIRNAGQNDIVHTSDALAEPAFAARESIRRARIRSLIAVPIRLGDRILGCLYLDHRGLTDLCGPQQLEFARFIADVAALGIHNALELELREEQVRHLRGELADDGLVLPRGLVANCPSFRHAFRTGVRAARDGRAVLLTGETGTGKDHLARVIHDASGRRGDFVECALPSLSESLFESEIFGVARGAATMVSERPGMVEAAQDGTLFLNEIGDLSLALQPKLLHFLDHRKYRRVGSSDVRTFDGLIICATNARLQEKVANGSFREDLFHRLAECMIEIPPLHKRQTDVAPLAELFLGQITQRAGRASVALHPRAVDLLRRTVWAGNVRELRATMARALDAMEGGDIVRPEHLHSPSIQTLRETWKGHGVPFTDVVSQEEIRRIHDALTRSAGIVSRAAESLGISPTALTRRIKKYRVEHLALQSRGRPPRNKSRGTGATGSDDANGHRLAP